MGTGKRVGTEDSEVGTRVQTGRKGYEQVEGVRSDREGVSYIRGELVKMGERG